MAAIEAEGLVKVYRGRKSEVRALDGVDLDVQTGTVLGLLGPNGAGKTTTVRILATLLRPDAGSARVAGIDVLRDPQAVRRVIGLSGQYAAVDENLTGRENLWMFGKLYGLDRARRCARLSDPLDQFDMMVRIRRFEQRAIRLVLDGDVRGGCARTRDTRRSRSACARRSTRRTSSSSPTAATATPSPRKCTGGRLRRVCSAATRGAPVVGAGRCCSPTTASGSCLGTASWGAVSRSLSAEPAPRNSARASGGREFLRRRQRTRGRSTRHSCWPRCGAHRWCSCARTTSTRR